MKLPLLLLSCAVVSACQTGDCRLTSDCLVKPSSLDVCMGPGTPIEELLASGVEDGSEVGASGVLVLGPDTCGGTYALAKNSSSTGVVLGGHSGPTDVQLTCAIDGNSVCCPIDIGTEVSVLAIAHVDQDSGEVELEAHSLCLQP